MYRTHNCGELRIEHVNQTVKLSGWVQSSRDLGGLTFIDLRDRYGITQLVFNMDTNAELCAQARKLGREFVISIDGTVRERSNKNPDRATGDIEIEVTNIQVLNASDVPPFTIEEETDGGDDLRMKYRYLDLRRPTPQSNIIFRSKLALETRKYLDSTGFIESRDALPDQIDPGRRPRFRGAQPHEPRTVLRACLSLHRPSSKS
jgi:aspartyl-tRNA synthetase